MEKVIKFLAGFKLASALLLILLVLTYLGTIEQTYNGIYGTINKYFTWKNFIVVPDLLINEKKFYLPPLPGAYWVCVLLFFNMLLGGILRIRKNWRNVFVVISHFGILFLLVGGFVGHHFSNGGYMLLYENETGNYVKHYHHHSIEVALLNDEGFATEIYEFDHKDISDIPEGNERSLELVHTKLPFSLSLNNYIKNSRPLPVGSSYKKDSKVLDEFYLHQLDDELEAEANYPGCLVKVSNGEEFLLFSSAFPPYKILPYIVNYEGKKYSVTLRKSIWKLPFQIRLDKFNAGFYRSGKPKEFESYITRIDGKDQNKFHIYMNRPMRYNGYTFFQHSYNSNGIGAEYSQFDVVHNPADQWPKYSIFVTTVGLLGHFCWTLINFIMRENRKKKS